MDQVFLSTYGAETPSGRPSVYCCMVWPVGTAGSPVPPVSVMVGPELTNAPAVVSNWSGETWSVSVNCPGGWAVG